VFVVSADTTMQLLTTQHPKLNFQIAQLPRVVQEILKYVSGYTTEQCQSFTADFVKPFPFICDSCPVVIWNGGSLAK